MFKKLKSFLPSGDSEGSDFGISKLKDMIPKEMPSVSMPKVSLGGLKNINLGNTKSSVISKAAGIDYSNVAKHLDVVPVEYEAQAGVARGLMGVLGEASRIYNSADPATRDDQFITHLKNNVNLEQTVTIIEPVMEYVPYGKVIMMGLNYLVNKTKK